MAAPLLVVTGPPGAGKSTVAAVLAGRFPESALVEVDAFFGFLRAGAIEPWLPAARAQNETVIQAAGSAAGRYARGGLATVVEGMVGPWFLPAFARAAAVDDLDYLVLLPSAATCAARVSSRVGHVFDDEDVTLAMHDQFSTTTIDGRHVLRDPPDDVDALAAQVMAALEDGQLRHPGL
jgi:energy-coupling factor transporter ATP-binding protein EcfA2